MVWEALLESLDWATEAEALLGLLQAAPGAFAKELALTVSSPRPAYPQVPLWSMGLLRCGQRCGTGTPSFPSPFPRISKSFTLIFPIRPGPSSSGSLFQ